MPQFKDSAGRVWPVAINVNSAKRVRLRTNVDLFNLFGEMADSLFADPCRLVEVLYALLEPQIQLVGLTPEQFGEGMVGDPLESAGDALLDALIDFFPQSRRPALTATRDKAAAVGRAMNQRVLAAVEAIDPQTFGLPSPSTGFGKPIDSAGPQVSTPDP